MFVDLVIEVHHLAYNVAVERYYVITKKTKQKTNKTKQNKTKTKKPS